MKLYTWKDIERYFCLTQEKWRNVINSVEVYPTDIILYIPENHQKDCSQTVQELFGNNYLKESNHIKLDIGCDEIPISILFFILLHLHYINLFLLNLFFLDHQFHKL